MLIPRHSPTIDSETVRSIRRMVDRHVRQHPHVAAHRDDLIQEVSLHILLKSANYNPKLGAWSTFVKCVARNKLRSLQREINQQLVRQPAVSLNERRQNRDGRSTEMIDTVPESSSPTQRFQEVRSVEHAFEVRCDVQAFMSSLDVELRDVCGELMRESQAKEVAKSLKISVSTVYRRIVSIRQSYEKCRVDSSQ